VSDETVGNPLGASDAGDEVEITDLEDLLSPPQPLWTWAQKRLRKRGAFLPVTTTLLTLALGWLVLSPLLTPHPLPPASSLSGVRQPDPTACPWPEHQPLQPALAGVAVAQDARTVFVADLGYDRVEKLSATSGRPVASWGCLGREVGQFDFGILQGSAAALDAQGHLYIADEGNQRVQIFDSSGHILAAWPLADGPGSGNGGELEEPLGIAVGGGRVFVIDFADGEVRLFSPDGRRLAPWGTPRGVKGPLAFPSGIAASATGVVYISDMRTSHILAFTPGGHLLTSWGCFGRGPGCFESPMGIAVDAQGNVYVADRDNNRVQKFDARGRFLTSWTVWNPGRPRLATPVGVAVDTLGRVYVIASNSGSVQEYDGGGKRLASL
jgi:DNA-binding beta-propeller fold protein YncE